MFSISGMSEGLERGGGAPARRDYLDIARGIAMLLVVIGHSSPPKPVKTAIFSFHIPLFFVISGMLYRRKRNAVAKDLIQLVVPYAVTVLILFAFGYIRLQKGMSMYYDSYGALLRSALFGSGTGYKGIRLIGEIWFLLALFWSRRLMDGVFCFEGNWIRTLCVAALLIFGIAVSRKKVFLPLNVDVAMVAVGFMFVGWLLENRTSVLEDREKRIAILWACVMIFCVGFQYCKLSMSGRKYGEAAITLPTAVAGSVAVICLSQYIARFGPAKAFLSFVGRHSLLFLCIHSLDWRMPFPVWGYSVIAPYSDRPWHWAMSALCRFSFDFAVTCAVVLAVAGIRRIRRAKAG